MCWDVCTVCGIIPGCASKCVYCLCFVPGSVLEVCVVCLDVFWDMYLCVWTDAWICVRMWRSACTVSVKTVASSSLPTSPVGKSVSLFPLTFTGARFLLLDTHVSPFHIHMTCLHDLQTCYSPVYVACRWAHFLSPWPSYEHILSLHDQEMSRFCLLILPRWPSG